MLRSGNDTPEEATAAEMTRQQATIQSSTPGEDTVAEKECRRVYILDRPQEYASDLLEEDKSLTTTTGAPSTLAVEYPHEGPERRHQRLEHYRKKLECRHHHHEVHLLLHPGTQLLPLPGSNCPLRLESHRINRITRPPVRHPTRAWRTPSTASTPKRHRGKTPRPRVWISSAPIETHFGSRRRKTG